MKDLEIDFILDYLGDSNIITMYKGIILRGKQEGQNKRRHNDKSKVMSDVGP